MDNQTRTEPEQIGSQAYVTRVQSLIGEVTATQLPAVAEAADIIVERIRDGGVVQTFATGHSEAFAMELVGRAGGFVPTNRLALHDIIVYGGAPAEVLADPHAERDPALAARVLELAPVGPRDVFVIASQSGGNGATVEMARLAAERGHPVIAVTSLAHTRAITSRHPSGKRLFELADVVIDNRAPHGDAVLSLPSGGSLCGVSSIGAALIAQLLTAEVAARMVAAGEQPPIYLSANIEGGDEHNDALEARYVGRIRRNAY